MTLNIIGKLKWKVKHSSYGPLQSSRPNVSLALHFLREMEVPDFLDTLYIYIYMVWFILFLFFFSIFLFLVNNFDGLG